MSSNLVIAAIPDENDRVWKVSSEKIPHLTVLFLGDTNEVSNLEQIMLFVQHAADTSLKRFYLPVDRRGELGDDKADVLFFKKGRYDYKAIRDFRATLLQDHNIKTAYDSAKQFDGVWQPHLTLGYPETPAEQDDYAGPFYDVCFNKLAVWTGDFEGPDFLLKDYWDEMDELDIPMDVAMSDLSHAATVSDTPWSQFKDSDYDDAQYARACLLDRGESAGSAKQRYGLPVREPNGTVNRNACHAAAAVLSSTGGTGSARGSKVKGTPEQLASAKKKLVSLYKSTLDEDVPEGLGGDMKQAAELGVEFLEHYGKKGMKWGVRTANVGSSAKGGAKAVGRGAKKVGKGLVTFADDVAFETEGSRKVAQRSVVRTAGKKFNQEDLPRINAKYKETQAGSLKGRLKNPLHKDTIAYRSESRIAYRDRINETVANLPTNASKSRKYEIEDGGKTNTQYHWSLKVVDVKRTVNHADIVDANALLGDFDVRPIFDEDGFIVDVKLIENTLAQSDDLELSQISDIGAEFIEHYGKKGMHWGQRKAPPAAVTPSARSVVPHGDKRKTKIETKGGQNHDAAPDAIKVAQHRTKLAKSGTAALSNAELREVANRLQLEQQVNQLSKGPAQKFVSQLLKQQGQEEGKRILSKGAKKAFSFS